MAMIALIVVSVWLLTIVWALWVYYRSRLATLRGLRTRVVNQRRQLHSLQREHNALWESFRSVVDECSALRNAMKVPVPADWVAEVPIGIPGKAWFDFVARDMSRAKSSAMHVPPLPMPQRPPGATEAPVRHVRAREDLA